MTGVWGDTGHMPPALAALHADAPQTEARGLARVESGSRLVARLIARLVGFPHASPAVPLHVEIRRDVDGETWIRRFAGQGFTSRMTRRGCWVIEQFGALSFAFALHPVPGGHAMVLQRWWCGPVRLPLALAPRIGATETDAEGRFAFDVRIALPLFGLLVAYRGSLVVPAPAIDPANWSLSDEYAAIQASNVCWLAIPTMGEAWHGNHHVFPTSARHGLYPGQVDPGWLFIRALAAAPAQAG